MVFLRANYIYFNLLVRIYLLIGHSAEKGKIMIIIKTQALHWLQVATIVLMGLLTVSAQADEDVITLTEQEAIEKAKAYYDSKGEWAGKFTITKVRQVRFQQLGPKSVMAHIRYQAGFLMDLSRLVEDQRTFTFVYGDGWVVTAMGGHKSASF